MNITTKLDGTTTITFNVQSTPRDVVLAKIIQLYTRGDYMKPCHVADPLAQHLKVTTR